MNAAKIRLSQDEQTLVQNAEWILTKNNILESVTHFFAALQVEQATILSTYNTTLPSLIAESSAKISKGENYLGLPYQVLDYPRFFKPEAVFAIRTMFWWGHFFSTTLHVSGNFKPLYEDKIVQAYEQLIDGSFYYCVHNKPWDHHFNEDNYLPIENCRKAVFEKHIRENSFLKIAKKHSLADWDNLPAILLTDFKELIAITATRT